VGLGTGKATEVQAAVQKAAKYAKKDMIRVPLMEGTIPHEVDTKFKAARIRLIPAREGTGIIAGGALRVILEHAGVKNVLSKRFGTTNKLVNAQAVMVALKSFHGTVAAGKDKEEIVVEGDGKEDAVALEKERMEVKEVSRKEVEG
jgi:small subunit ribosomal protein S5